LATEGASEKVPLSGAQVKTEVQDDTSTGETVAMEHSESYQCFDDSVCSEPVPVYGYAAASSSADYYIHENSDSEDDCTDDENQSSDGMSETESWVVSQIAYSNEESDCSPSSCTNMTKGEITIKINTSDVVSDNTEKVACSICMKVFSSKWHLEVHERTTKKCRHCDLTLNQEMIEGTNGCADVMMKHVRVHHQVYASSDIHCPYCEYTVDPEMAKSADQCRIVMAAHTRERHPEHCRSKPEASTCSNIECLECRYCDFRLDPDVKRSAGVCRTLMVTHTRTNHPEHLRDLPKKKRVRKEPNDPNEKITCTFCTKVITGRKKYKNHLHHHRRKMKCPYCEFSVDPEILKNPDECRVSMAVHRRENHPQHFQKYLCDICGRGMACRDSLLHHKIDMHDFKCETMKKKKCPHCEEVLVGWRQLEAHLAREHSEKLQCTHPGCSKIFANRRRLRFHIKSVHIKENDIGCTYVGCKTKFSCLKHMQRHIEQIHLRQRNFLCDFPQCEKTFYSAYNLRVHKRVHSDEKPLKCPHCDYRAAQRNSELAYEKTYQSRDNH
jgi:hypothetical protein